MKTTPCLLAALIAAAPLSALATEAAPADAPTLSNAPGRPDVGLSAAVGLTDLGFRAVEGGAATGLVMVSAVTGMSFSGPAVNPGAATASLVGAGALLLVMPALDALVCAGMDRDARHPLAPLLATAYVSHLGVDALTLALLGTSWGAPIAYAVGSLAGAASMGLVYGATAQQLPAAPAAAVDHAPAIPTSISQSTVARF